MAPVLWAEISPAHRGSAGATVGCSASGADLSQLAARNSAAETRTAQASLRNMKAPGSGSRQAQAVAGSGRRRGAIVAENGVRPDFPAKVSWSARNVGGRIAAANTVATPASREDLR